MTRKSRIAFKHVNVLDRVIEETRTLVPVPFTVTQVEPTRELLSFARPKRPGSLAWQDFCDVTLKDFVKSGLLGQ